MINQMISIMLGLPPRITEAETELVKATIAVKKAEDALADKEAELILSGQINGKNESERKAQLNTLTKEERAALLSAQEEQLKAKLAYNSVVNELRVLRTLMPMFYPVQAPEQAPTGPDLQA